MTTTHGGSGQYNALCDVCGFKYKNHQLKKRWDGFIVCAADWEPRHPLDFYKSRNDTHQLPWTRPDNEGIDVGPTYTYPDTPDYGGGLGSGILPNPFCTLATIEPLADQGSADCATLTI